MLTFVESRPGRPLELDGGRDWRRGVGGDKIPFEETWFPTGHSRFDDAWRNALGETEGKCFPHIGVSFVTVAARPTAIGVYGRRLLVPAAAGRVCRFEFTDLCEQVSDVGDFT